MQLNDDMLLSWNRLGLIPGPNEDKASFIQRVDYCLNLHNTLGATLEIGVGIDPQISEKFIHEASPITQQLFDITPTWTPVIFSNHKLAPWHGGCAWIFQMTEETPTGAFFQLRKAFKTSSRYLYLYHREELIAHESAHVGRMMFEEPIFEELLAYQTSPSSFRKYFGPIAQSSRDSFLFVLVLLFACLGISVGVFWALLFPLGLLLYGIIRICRKQHQFTKCRHVLQKMLKDVVKTDAVIYRLQDKEIIAFGRMSPSEIVNYIETEKKHSLRWYVIALAYL